MSGFQEYWQNLGSRERRIFIWGGAIAGVILFYSMIWDPWHNSIREMRKNVPEKFETLVWLDRQKQAVIALRDAARGNQSTKPTSLLSFLELSANRSGLRKNLEIVPAREGETRVSLRTVQFDPALGFVQGLMKSGVELRSILFKKGKQPGEVDVALTIVN